MWINKLPNYIINKLKAWEVVERPCSVVKELIENSLDAGANKITLEIIWWWKKLIKLEDNWVWIDTNDIALTIESYATSKISTEDDLFNISSYWFRWEALSTISEVSKFTIQTKNDLNEVWTQLKKIDKEIFISKIPFDLISWTTVIVEDLFFNVPVREKFLKSETTEYWYILDTFLNFSIINFDVDFKLINNWKIIKYFEKDRDIFSRILKVFKSSRQDNLIVLENIWDNCSLYWVTSDSSLTFSTPSNIKLFVNKRPVDDKIIKKSILQSYQRQIAPWEYPLSVIFLEINPKLVDVNVHPRKKEVKFQDPNSIFNFIQQSYKKAFSLDKISNWDFLLYKENNNISNLNWSIENKFNGYNSSSINYSSSSYYRNQNNKNIYNNSSLNFNNSNIFWNSSFSDSDKDNYYIDWNWIEYKVIWQIWNSYIIVEWVSWIYFVDQHALAERISFEKLKKDLSDNRLNPELVLNPIIISIPNNIDFTNKISQFSNLWFDISYISENELAIYSVPSIFIKYNIDIQWVMNKLIYLEEINLDIVFDNIFATKACKASIKAWDKLSMPEMVNLIKDWYKFIDKMFVCQHWRPSIVEINKWKIEKLFDR